MAHFVYAIPGFTTQVSLRPALAITRLLTLRVHVSIQQKVRPSSAVRRRCAGAGFPHQHAHGSTKSHLAQVTSTAK